MSKSICQKISVLFLLLYFILSVNSLSINPETGAYSDLVIAISETALNESATLQEKEKMVADLQTLLQEMSTAMFEATEEQVYLGQVIILVPRSWNYLEASDQPYRFQTAEIRVDNPNPLLGDLPYTQQPHVCGVQGRYIHVTPAFVARDSTVLERTGPPGHAMIHEWAQFRWGVREEYGYPGDERYPYFYRDQAGNWVPTGSNSSDTMTGALRTKIGEPCKFKENGEPDIDCRFYPDLNSSASLLHFHHLETPLKFSTSENNNRLSPHKQGSICGLRSSWEVISAHSDMQGRVRVPRVVPKVLFVVGQPATASTDALYVVLDSSSNGDPNLTNDIFAAVKAELRSFFTDFSDSARVALFTYQGFDSAYEFKELVPLKPLVETRNDILQALEAFEPDTAEIRRAADVAFLNISYVAKQLGNGESGVVFFTQNGRGSNSELDSIPALQDANLAVVGVGYLIVSNAPNMFTVCTSTGGRAFILEQPFEPGFQQAINFAGLGDDPSTTLYQVAFEVLRVRSNETVEALIYIEAALGRDTSFALDNPVNLDPALLDPEGEEISLTSDPRCKMVTAAVMQQYICSFPNAKSGEWKVRYTCVDSSEEEGDKASYTVTSYVRLPEDATWDPSWPKLDTWTSGEAGVVDLTREELIVYVELHSLYLPLVNASVISILEDPTVKDLKIIEILRDDGNEPDIVADDGIYAAKIRPISSNPMFLSIQVTSDDQSPAFISSRGRSWGVLPVDQGSFCCGSGYDNGVVAEKYRMERTLNKTFIVRFENINDYKMAPQTVEDLMIVGIKTEEDNAALVSLKWTAPFPRDGTDRVIAYELYVSLDAEIILNNIEAATLVTSDHVVSGDLEPLPGGALQELGVRIEVPDNFDNAVFFRLRSVSDESIKASLSRVTYSNIASAIENNPGPGPKPPGDPLVTQTAWFIAVMVVLGLILVVAIVGSTWLVRRRRRRIRHARATVPRSPPVSLNDEVIETGLGNPGVELDSESRRASSEQTTEL